jgi:hypothetical protein
MDIPHEPLAQGYASLDIGAPCVKEQSCAATATAERNLANQTTGCTLRQKKETGPPARLLNPRTYVKKTTGALSPVRKREGISI